MEYNVLSLVETAWQKVFPGLVDTGIMIQAETLKNKLRVGGNFKNSQSLLDFVTEQEIVYGIYFLEIELEQDKNGLDVAEQILEVDPYAQIIFITRSLLSAQKIFDRQLHALDCIFIDKITEIPLQERMNILLEAAVRRHDQVSQAPKQLFSYQVEREVYLENLDNVIYVTTSKYKAHHLEVHLLNTTVDITGNLQSLLERYPTLKQISQSCLVNLRNIKHVDFSTHKIVFQNDEVEYYPARTNFEIRKLLKDFLNN